MRVWTGLSGSVRGQVAGCCEYTDGPLGCIKCREFFWLREGLFASQVGFCSLELVSKPGRLVM